MYENLLFIEMCGIYCLNLERNGSEFTNTSIILEFHPTLNKNAHAIDVEN